MKKNYIKKFIAVFTTVALIITGLVFTVSATADVPENQEKILYEKNLEQYYASFLKYMADVVKYEELKADSTADPADVQSMYDSLESTYKSLISAWKIINAYRAGLEAEAYAAYNAALELYKTRKAAYDAFDWNSYAKSSEEYEKEYVDYENFKFKVERGMTNKITDGKRVLYYNDLAIAENIKDLSKLKGKTYAKKAQYIDMGKGVVITYAGSDITVEFDGTAGGFGIYDIYFESDGIVYHLLIELTNKGSYVVTAKNGKKDKVTKLIIDNILVNQDTKNRLSKSPVSPVSPAHPGSEPSLSDFGGFCFPAYPCAPSAP